MTDSQGALRPSHVLVVEDDAALAELVKAILAEEGIDSRLAFNGAQALTHLASAQPKLVLLDYSLPDMTGLDVVERAGDMPPFLITTGMGDERVAVECMKRGAREYLVKDAHFVGSLPLVVRRVMRDVETEGRLAEAEARLRESQEQLRLVLERTNNIFWDWDLSRDRYVMSERGYHMLGYDSGEVIPDVEAWKAHLHPEDLGRMMKLLQDHLAGTNPSFEAEFRLRTKRGGWVWVLSRGQVVARNEAGRPLRISGIMTEITEMKRAEETIRQAEKSGSLSLMAAGIAHDFNNQFQTLLGNLELAQRGVKADTREGKALARAVDVLRNAAQLSQKMLDFTGKSFRQIQRISTSAWLRDQDGELQRLARAFPQATFRHVSAEALPAIDVDPGQMAQILRNLLQNGLEALGGRAGMVCLEAKLQMLRPQEIETLAWVERPAPGLYICISVQDDGPGIVPEILSRAGDPFISTKGSGRGLGLATTRGILRSYGGGLRIHSETGQGTCVYVCFPVAEALVAPAPALSAEGEAADSGRKTLLLVDDEDALREVMAEAIRDVLGHTLLEARDGLEALDVFQAHEDEIALVLMDAKMPRMSGTEAFQRMKERKPDLKAILCSGYSEEFGLSTAQGFGFMGFLKKPFSLSALEEAIQKALGR